MAKKVRTAVNPAPNSPDLPCRTCLPGCEAEAYMQDVLRLLTDDLTYSQFIDGKSARKLVAVMLRSYAASQNSTRWSNDEFLLRMGEGGKRASLVLSAIFDYVTNVEYCLKSLGRVTDTRWIYCNAAAKGKARAHVYYSFLKQCPYCCLRVGLGARIEKAQHKPPSHHIGEISGSLMGLLSAVVLASAEKPFKIGLVQKQSHSVDAIAYRDDTAILLEVKASPLVTFPLGSDLTAPLLRDAEDGSTEFEKHTLIDFPHSAAKLYFFVAHRDQKIDLGVPDTDDWPYPPATKFVSSVDGFLDYVSAWSELYSAFSVPKTERTGRIASVSYLTNGWGDEIDSNKTKPGLGRTDDLKKGTYQLLKFGAYYKDLCKRRTVYSALLANLDPVNLWSEYLARLLKVRWTKEDYIEKAGEYFKVPKDRLYYLYEAIIAFNRPVINDRRLEEAFDFERLHRALVDGKINPLLSEWTR